MPKCRGAWPYSTSNGECPKVEWYIVLYQNSVRAAKSTTCWVKHAQHNANMFQDTDSGIQSVHLFVDGKTSS
jgi:hypothetical protein